MAEVLATLILLGCVYLILLSYRKDQKRYSSLTEEEKDEEWLDQQW